MAWSSAKVHLQSSTSTAARASLFLVICLLLATSARAQVQDAAAALGIGDTHGSLSFAPWERIDTFTGNVLLTFTDLDLPGNAGFNLTIRRYYNSKNGFALYLDYGFPLRVWTTPSPGVPVLVYPIILMPDGSQVRTLQDPNDSTRYMTTTNWRVHTASTGATIETPAGVTYFFDADGHPNYKTDAFGN